VRSKRSGSSTLQNLQHPRQGGRIDAGIDNHPNERRQVISNERDMPWRLAVDDIARGA
jgi:hypothetical protein